MTEMKLCKDCKHYKKDWISHTFPFFGAKGYFDECRREKNDNLVVGGGQTTNLVVGGRQTTFCEIERRNYSALDVCGVKGKYWEAK
jgi:hypothetical protein